MSEFRRRRMEPDAPKGGLPIFPLILLVIFAGLLLGGALAKFFGRGGPIVQASSAPSFTPLPSAAAELPAPTSQSTPTATPTPLPSATATIKPTPKSSPTATASASAAPSASATPTATPSATPKPSAKPTATPRPTASPTPRPSVVFVTPKPTATAKPTIAPTDTPTPANVAGPATAQHAASIVRSYLAAMARGDDAFATGYLKTGLPTETFLSKGARITSVQPNQNPDGSFTVTAQIVAPSGQYSETFRLENGPNGLQITQHTPVMQ